mmetsp:Transcript_11481/g.70594  ORF Transcript_11481/g.70594 Transcript_11481/m.70594 type:complete len:220 (-) Transcript_11481:687-1346(-)
MSGRNEQIYVMHFAGILCATFQIFTKHRPRHSWSHTRSVHYRRSSATCTAFNAAPLRIWSPQMKMSKPLLSGLEISLRILPTNTSSLLEAMSGVGKSFSARLSYTDTPGAAARTSLASSSVMSELNSRLMLSACARITGTRMHVAVTCTSLVDQIFPVSLTNFISSSLYPFSPMSELWEKRLNAYCLPKISMVRGSLFSACLVCISSSSMAACPAPLAA